MIPQRIYIAPTEPPELRSIGSVSLLPETMGCDILVYSYSPLTIIGYQRKELSDFLASLTDGRLAKELGQMSDSTLTYRLLILEGTPQWTTDGKLATQYGQQMDRISLTKILLSVQSSGCFTLSTSSLAETIQYVQSISSWLITPHNALLTRPKRDMRNSWGTVNSRSFASHLLQSFPGIGPATAEAIYSHYGTVPLVWQTDVKELAKIPGIGKKTAERLIKALEVE